MSIEKIPLRVQHKRMTASEWASSSLILLDGELGIESDTGKVKVGNGSNRFANLQYLTGPKGDRGERGIQGLQGNPGRDGIVTFQSLTQQEKESLKGDRGEPGRDGESSYTHVKYSKYSNGYNMNDDPESTYMGIYTGTSSTPPTNMHSYKWSRIKGKDGDQGQRGQPGVDGRAGADGRPGQNIINQQNNQPMKYWAGTEAQFNAIPSKDPNTIYDIFK
mgnify:CR=1 FL=1